LKRRKENIVYVNGGHAIAIVSIKKSSLAMKKTFPDKGILKNLIRKGKNLTFYIAVNKAKTLNKP